MVKILLILFLNFLNFENELPINLIFIVLQYELIELAEILLILTTELKSICSFEKIKKKINGHKLKNF